MDDEDISTPDKLNFSCKIEKVFLAARSHQFLQGKPNQLILCGEGGNAKKSGLKG